MIAADERTAFQPVTADDLAYFESVCPGRVQTGAQISDDCCHDEMKLYGERLPDALVEARSASEVSKILRHCSARRIAVTPRGAGTGLCGGCVAVHGGIVLSTAGMNRVLEIDHRTMTATVEPGVLLMDLIAAFDREDVFYPPDPGEKSATIGGNVMTNAGGMRAVRFGVTRDYVRGLEAVLPGGEIVELGGKLAKNSSGYSLKDLLIGSEGTLAVVTRIILRLLPKQRCSCSMLVPFPGISEAIAAVPGIISSDLQPTAVEFMQKEVVSLVREYLGRAFPDTAAPAYLLATVDAVSEKQSERMAHALARLCVELGAIDVFFADTDERKESLWVPRGAFLEAIKASAKEMDECDVVVPIDRIAEFVGDITALSDETGVRINYFGHAGDGNLHVYVCFDGGDRAAWDRKCEQIMDSLYRRAGKLGGQVSGEHGIGHAKVRYLEQSVGEAQIALMRGIKQTFDPAGILNPGKVLAI